MNSSVRTDQGENTAGESNERADAEVAPAAAIVELPKDSLGVGQGG